MLLHFMYIMPWIISLGFCYSTSIYKFLILQQESSPKAYFMGSFNSKILYQKCVTKKFCQLCINYELNKCILNIKIQTRCNWKLIICYSISCKRLISVPLETLIASKSTRWTVLYLSFKFHNNTYITISMSSCNYCLFQKLKQDLNWLEFWRLTCNEVLHAKIRSFKGEDISKINQ